MMIVREGMAGERWKGYLGGMACLRGRLHSSMLIVVLRVDDLFNFSSLLY